MDNTRISEVKEKPSNRPITIMNIPIEPLPVESYSTDSALIWDNHPVTLGRGYILDTDSAFSTIRFIEDAIEIGEDGLLVYGRSYAGKSSAMNTVAEYFRKEYDGRMKVVMITCEDQAYTYRKFNSLIAKGFGFEIPRKAGNSPGLADYTVSGLLQAGMENGRNILLILDEAEGLSVDRFKNLKYIYNELAKAPYYIRLITVVVGTHSLYSKANMWESSGDSTRQVTRRFMQQKHEFKGITGENSLAFVLSGYDHMTYEGKTYTEFFFPEAWENGCRAEDLAKDYLTAMTEVSRLTRLPRELPIGYVVRLTEALFRKFGNNPKKPSESRWITIEDIMQVMEMQDIKTKLHELKFAEDHENLGRRGM